MIEFLALHGHMATDRLRSRLGIAPLQRGNHRLVLGHRLFETAAQAQLQPAKRGEAPMQALAFLLEEGVARLAVENRMEAFVLSVVAVVIARLERGLATRIRLAHLLQGGVGDSGRCQPGAGGLELGHHLEHLDQLHRSRLSDKDPAPRDLLHQARDRKPLKCLAQRRARYAKPVRQPNLVEPLAIGKGAVEDHPLQGFGNRVGPLVLHSVRIQSQCSSNKAIGLVYKELDARARGCDFFAPGG